ncbi:MAG: AmmeMemoRadiSam system protein B [Candidatus Norongarragalinales archaeon]
MVFTCFFMGARLPAVAGSFYPSSKRGIEAMLSRFAAECNPFESGAVKAVVAPHAGWVYSGKTAFHSFKALKQACEREKGVRPVFVIVCPNHSGTGAPVALSMENWLTPLGEAKCSQKVAASVLTHSEFVVVDESAHEREHSAEVQLPFLQYFFKENFEFAAIALLRQDFVVARDLAKSILMASREAGEKVFVVASSDFTHYEPRRRARAKDEHAIEALLELDSKEFLKRVDEEGVSACGPGAVVTAAEYARLAGARKGTLLDFSDSGRVSGEDSVVDYASIAFQ